MKSSKRSFYIIGISMLLFASEFILYTQNYPEASFPWNNNISNIVYFACVIAGYYVYNIEPHSIV